MEDELESLREKSTRASSLFDELEGGDEGAGESAGFLSSLTPQQRLILAILLLIDIVACGFALLVVTGRISLFA